MSTTEDTVAEWMRVEERLPTAEGLYLVAVAWPCGDERRCDVTASNFVLFELKHRYWLCAERYTDRWTCWEKESRDFGWRVTHWAPLPEGPEEA